MLLVMAGVVLVLVILLLAGLAVSFVRRRHGTLVAKRGMSIGADLGTMSDQPRVHVTKVAITGPDRVRVLLAPESPQPDNPRRISPSDLDLVVSLEEGELGLDLLREWQRSACPLAIVVPPGSRLVRLRSIEDLQPLTLRRLDLP